jgi:methylphosphotriester-DNA--protein-cysteine methyltransferase
MSRYLFFPRNLLVVPYQSGIYCLPTFPTRIEKTINVPYQSGIYCLPTFPTRIEKTINVPYQSGIYCPQDIVRS